MKTKKVKLSEIKIGPIRQGILPNGFIKRVQKYKEILKEVETSSIEETMGMFMRDTNPEDELKIWESIARTYKETLDNEYNFSLNQKEEIFSVLLNKMLGMN